MSSPEPVKCEKERSIADEFGTLTELLSILDKTISELYAR